jgi:hypothetical protein
MVNPSLLDAIARLALSIIFPDIRPDADADKPTVNQVKAQV